MQIYPGAEEELPTCSMCPMGAMHSHFPPEMEENGLRSAPRQFATVCSGFHPSLLYSIILSPLAVPSTCEHADTSPHQHEVDSTSHDGPVDPTSKFNCCPSSLQSLRFKFKSSLNLRLYIFTSQSFFSFFL